MKKNNFKIILFYFVLILVAFAALSLLLQKDEAEPVTYSDVIEYFQADAVREFVIDDSFYITMRVYELDENGEVAVDTFSNGWLYPSKVTEKIKGLFPNSTVYAFHQFPKQVHNMRILSDSINYDDVIFLTFSEPLAYTGSEHLTRRVETLIRTIFRWKI